MNININLKNYYKNILIEAASIDSIDTLVADDGLPPNPFNQPPANPFLKPTQTTQPQPGNGGNNQQPRRPRPPTGIDPEDWESESEEVPGTGGRYRYIQNPDGTYTVYELQNGQWVQVGQNLTVEQYDDFLRDVYSPPGSTSPPGWGPDFKVIINPGPPPTIKILRWFPLTQSWEEDPSIITPNNFDPSNWQGWPGWQQLNPENGYPYGIQPPPQTIPGAPNPTLFNPLPSQPGYVEAWRWDGQRWIRETVPGQALTLPPYNIPPEFLPPGFQNWNPDRYPNIVTPGPGWYALPGGLYQSPDGGIYYWGPGGMTPYPLPDGFVLPAEVRPVAIPYPGGIPNPLYPHKVPYVMPPYTPGQPWPPSWFNPNDRWRMPGSTPGGGGSATPNVSPNRSPNFFPGIGPLSQNYQGYDGPNPYYM